jgi:hypothetical protein
VGGWRSRTPDPEAVTDLRTFARRAQARGRAAIRLSRGPTRRRWLHGDEPHDGDGVRVSETEAAQLAAERDVADLSAEVPSPP